MPEVKTTHASDNPDHEKEEARRAGVRAEAQKAIDAKAAGGPKSGSKAIPMRPASRNLSETQRRIDAGMPH